MTSPAASVVTRYKLPQITVMFWVLKIAATTLGETGGDMISQTLKLGYVDATALFLAILVVCLLTQLRVHRFHPALYWTVIAATSTAGTTMSDLINRGPGDGTAQNGLGYPAGFALLGSALVVVFVIWKFSGQTYDVTSITTFRGELLYWSAIVLSNTLGTSTGDFLSDSSGLGYWGSALLIAAVMAVILAAHYFTDIPGPVLFWIAFVLTRPLGAAGGDLLSKSHASGGLALGTYGTSAFLAVVLVAGVVYTHLQHRRARAGIEFEPVRTEPRVSGSSHGIE
jgi:uncharacterized membrane-anchored protein